MNNRVRILVGLSGLLVILNTTLPAQDSASCGVCHKSHYRQWLQSPHVQSWKSPDFQTQLKAFEDQQFCGRCHAPKSIWKTVDMTSIEQAAAGTSGPNYTPELLGTPVMREQAPEEGVSCGSCHHVGVIWNEASVSDDFVGPYHTEAGHGGRESGAFGGFQLCRSCHGRERQDYIPAGTTSEFHHSEAEAFPFAMETDCTGCHMPVSVDKLVQLSVFKDAPERTVREHSFGGGAHYQGLENALQFKIEADNSLVISNSGVGHPVRVSPRTHYRLLISKMEGGKALETTPLDFEAARQLAPGGHMTIPLPFPHAGPNSIRVEFVRVMKDGVEGKIFAKTL